MKTIRVVDLFCGAGGASEALKRACQELGVKLDLLAVNHSPIAIQTHRTNHPTAVHLCESIERVDPKTRVFVDPVTGARFKNTGRFDLLIAAPECTHHSTARGGRPINDQSRATAWHILKWHQECYIDHTLIENVPEFREWGPIGANHRPLKSRKGEIYRAFLDALRAVGNKVHEGVYNAADYGDPTTRRRLFVMASRGHKAPKPPSPTHSRTGSATLFGPTKKWRAAREVIDWTITGQSIFDRKRPLSPKTMARIVAGLERFGGEDLKPFLVILRNHADARSLDEPLPALCSSGQHMALVEPQDAAFIVPTTHGGGLDRVHDLADPFPTITCAHRGELAMVEPFVLQQQSGGVARPTDEPLPTIATDGAQMLVEPFVVTMEHRGSTRSINDPIPTITTAKRGAFAVVEAEVKPFMLPHFGERDGQAPRTHDVDAPLPTINATGQIDVVQPFIVSAGGPKVGPISTEQPMNTVLTRDHMALVEPIIASYYGTQNVSPVSAPLPTVTTKDRFALVMPVVNGRALDIRLRMLKPHELARAMSFGDDYQFAGNQGEKVKQIGNAWPCRLGQALLEALLADYATKRKPRKLEKIA